MLTQPIKVTPITGAVRKTANCSSRVNRLVELNVMAQVKNPANTSIIQKAWRSRSGFSALHGWVYDINDGICKSLVMTQSPDDLDSALRYQFTDS